MSFENLEKIFQFHENPTNEKLWNNLFQDASQQAFFSNANSIKSNNQFPPCDFYVKDGQYFIELELPGITPESIGLKCVGNELHIAGQYKTLHEEYAYFLKERQNRSFHKVITLPNTIIKEDITCELKYGILSVKIPRP
ncbi:Hsp20/alpha crystallin family protein [Niallia taxi]|uniref:Hsp20/alpha crystallin family protein n=1 Tax=Niallia taxi TaxID=2499688 RepID=UPI003D269EE7